MRIPAKKTLVRLANLLNPINRSGEMYLKVGESIGMLSVLSANKKHFWIVDAPLWLKQQHFDLDGLMVCVIELKIPTASPASPAKSLVFFKDISSKLRTAEHLYIYIFDGCFLRVFFVIKAIALTFFISQSNFNC